MKLVKASYKIEDRLNGVKILKRIEKAGRTCYQSFGRMTSDSYERFVRMILERGHESVLEHEKVTVRFIVDRGVSHEIVRHRIASFSQESTRFCNYMKEVFGKHIKVIKPCFWCPGDGFYEEWLAAMRDAERHYMKLMEMGARPEQARSVLPNSLKTEIVVTCNLREWRLVFKQRTAAAAHPQMREVMVPLLKEFKHRIPILFEDLFIDHRDES